MSLKDDLGTQIEKTLYGWDVHNLAITEEIVNLVWSELENAFDEGVGVAGRYGHEDGWDAEFSPYNRNPYASEPRGEEWH